MLCPNLKFYIVFVLVLIGISSSTQIKAQKCNYEKNEIDALTEMVVKRTTPEMLLRINGQPLYVKAQCIGQYKYLKILFFKYNNFSFKEDREIGLILHNSEEVVLYPRQSSVDTLNTDSRDDTSLLVYKLSEEQYAILKQSLVLKFKYFYGTGFVEESIKSSRQGKIKDVLICVE